jgi:hypothetical protein
MRHSRVASLEDAYMDDIRRRRRTGVGIRRPAALAALPGSYGPLFDRAAAVFGADERVRAMWLHGALARGKADAAPIRRRTPR